MLLYAKGAWLYAKGAKLYAGGVRLYVGGAWLYNTMILVATMFCLQCLRAAHSLCLDQIGMGPNS